MNEGETNKRNEKFLFEFIFVSYTVQKLFLDLSGLTKKNKTLARRQLNFSLCSQKT